MGQASRAIIIEGDEMLVMKRIKQGVEYYTLVGGLISDGETPEEALVREVKEETGFDVISTTLVYAEKHDAPLNDQFIYLCSIAPHGNVKIQDTSEEAMLNKIDINVHEPEWVKLKFFPKLAFSTMKLQKAITLALSEGFPDQPVRLS